MATNLHNLSEYDTKSVPSAKGMRFGIVVSEWNHHITGLLLEGAQTTLLKHGAGEEDILVMTVPGSFELVFGAARMAKSGKVDAVIAIGCVIRGDTPHFDYVSSEAASGLQLAAIETGDPRQAAAQGIEAHDVSLQVAQALGQHVELRARLAPCRFHRHVFITEVPVVIQ